MQHARRGGSEAAGNPEHDLSPPAWWLGEGAAPCRWCLQGYAVEVERRCASCDEPGCLHCMVRVRVRGVLRMLCPDCGSGASASSAAAGGRR